ncbi:MAG: YdaS family helix-turn-helix protein [Betaproteobacteria bacterium]|nr:YdaS family helix-turn-helix protein [Betaproteobacteria bacterium]
MMTLIDYLRALKTEKARTGFAGAAGTTVGYLRQIAYGFSNPSPNLCKAIERAANGVVSRYELRPDIHGENPHLGTGTQESVDLVYLCGNFAPMQFEAMVTGFQLVRSGGAPS